MGAIRNTIRSARDATRASLYRAAAVLKVRQYSNFDEEKLIAAFDALIPQSAKTAYIVDIAASDGIGMSNTYARFRSGTPGLAVEFDDVLFAKLSARYRRLQQVQLLKQMITPENVVATLEANHVHNCSLLNLDIDGYDHFVLDAILGSSYRPTLICAEINEKIPPPLKFTVNYSPHYRWNVDHFFGQSISQLYELCLKYRYDLVDLHYNNAFLIPHELNTLPALTPEQAYDRGYKYKRDRVSKFRYNHDMDPVLAMSPEDAKRFINEAFSKYKGQYTLS
jgi:hypothetical protein